ncbi:hypothetical protein MQM1_083 [Aeromonas phage vB_AsaP_MQM1]|nr:hypothetical protein MQM1_083 [Aeromonas phage vB_AsaP_MQM1]
MARFDAFAGMADNLTLAQMQTFKAQATNAKVALDKLEQIAGSSEPLSDYIGMSFSAVQEDLENLSLALDSRMLELQDAMECTGA